MLLDCSEKKIWQEPERRPEFCAEYSASFSPSYAEGLRNTRCRFLSTSTVGAECEGRRSRRMALRDALFEARTVYPDESVAEGAAELFRCLGKPHHPATPRLPKAWGSHQRFYILMSIQFRLTAKKVNVQLSRKTHDSSTSFASFLGHVSHVVFTSLGISFAWNGTRDSPSKLS